MKVYVTRHGRTDWNDRGKIQGRIDIPLNAHGVLQALELKEELVDVDFDIIMTSPLMRAKQTAEILNQDRDSELLCDERIAERNFGIYEGENIEEIDFSSLWNFKEDKEVEGVEPIRPFFKRIYEFLDEISNSTYEAILIVAHGGVSLPVHCYYCGVPLDGNLEELLLKNCEVVCYETEYCVRLLN